MLHNERTITICAAGSRRAIHWQEQTERLSEFYHRLKTPIRGVETVAAYLSLSKAEQDEKKDVGGFIGGTLKHGRRKADAVLGRDLITLDLDQLVPGQTGEVRKRLEGLNCGYAVYSTRKHTPACPRLRVILPLDRTVTADEYEPIARKMAAFLYPDMTPFDPTTFQASRLMYWPSCSCDSEYVYQVGDKPFVSADGTLGLYENWKDMTSWPAVPGISQTHKKLIAKQGDPEKKRGVVGAFCRSYSIYAVMDQFLAGLYQPVDDQQDRYTYLGGSTTGGAIVYENGAFLYSHHATDPAGSRLSNAFDLVRLHRFSELDDEAKLGTPTHKLPSFVEICRLANGDQQVAARMQEERYQQALQDFQDVSHNEENHPADWMSCLAYHPLTGAVQKTIKNVRLMLMHDPQLAGRIRLNEMQNYIIGTAPLPWGNRNQGTEAFAWGDSDDAGLRDYVEQLLGFRSREIVSDALAQHAIQHVYNPVAEYLEGVTWDGVLRIDTLYVDYFGAEDCPYVRAVTSKALLAAVARALEPGVKFDNMTVICGAQGIGKTTFFARLGKEWFTNSVTTFEGKDASELIQGVWIVEIGELEAFGKSDIKLVKQFLSKCDDQYRAAYARRTEKHPRRCVFFGTTNDHDYLKDPTGNRRFWAIDAGVRVPSKQVFRDLTEQEVDQIWAEAYQRWKQGESLILDAKIERQAEERRGEHMQRDPLRGVVEEFLKKPIPHDWGKWDLAARQMFWGGAIQNKELLTLVPRDRICALEIWRECLNDRRGTIPKSEAIRINAVLATLPDWERATTMRFGGGYGRQKGFRYTGRSTKTCQPVSTN